MVYVQGRREVAEGFGMEVGQVLVGKTSHVTDERSVAAVVWPMVMTVVAVRSFLPVIWHDLNLIEFS